MVRRYPILKVYTEAEVEAYHEAQNHAENQPALAQPPVAALPANEPVQIALPATPIAALPSNEPVQDIGSSSSNPTAHAEKEFFTPTTKNVLEEISKVNYVEQVHGHNTPKTKQMLAFEEPQAKKEPTVAAIESHECSNTADHTTATAHPLSEDPVQLSPSKKMNPKNKDA